jgi:hypothetical protein
MLKVISVMKCCIMTRIIKVFFKDERKVLNLNASQIYYKIRFHYTCTPFFVCKIEISINYDQDFLITFFASAEISPFKIKKKPLEDFYSNGSLLCNKLMTLLCFSVLLKFAMLFIVNKI